MTYNIKDMNAFLNFQLVINLKMTRINLYSIIYNNRVKLSRKSLRRMWPLLSVILCQPCNGAIDRPQRYRAIYRHGDAARQISITSVTSDSTLDEIDKEIDRLFLVTKSLAKYSGVN